MFRSCEGYVPTLVGINEGSDAQLTSQSSMDTAFVSTEAIRIIRNCQ
jgi:hypothetical protein